MTSMHNKIALKYMTFLSFFHTLRRDKGGHMASKLIKPLLLVLSTLLLTQAVSAKIRVNNYKKLQEIISLYKHNCDETAVIQDCRDEISTEMVFNIDQSVAIKLDDPTLTALKQIAEEQAQVWADTILEGDYAANGNTELGMVHAIYQQGELRAYHIFFFEKAWFTGDCNYDGENPNSLQSCQRGTINEAAFVDANLKAVLPDEDHYAEFSED